MKIYITVANGQGRPPQEDPKVKRLEENGWKLDSVHYPDGSEGGWAEVEMSKRQAEAPPSE